MNTFVSHSIPFKDIMKDLAEAMNTTFFQSCEEFRIIIPENFGSGNIRGINFPEGIGLMLYDCNFNNDTEIQFIVDEVHPLKFMFCEEGSIEHKFQDSDKIHRVSKFQNIIVASDKKRGHIIHFKKDERTKINNLEIDRRKFNELLRCEINKLKPGLRSLFQDVKGKNYFYHLGDYSLKTAMIFDRIRTFKGLPFQENILIHSEAYNIFFIQILEYLETKKSAIRESSLRKKDLESVRKAALIIDSEISNFQSVEQLGINVGLNENKLQSGFKEVYGYTVNQFVQNKRIEEAVFLIKNTDWNFSEIAEKVGISSKSYFSKLFKDKFGLTPTEIRIKTKGFIKERREILK